MSVQAINYYYTGIGLPKDIWQVLYDFVPSNGVIPSLSGANTGCYGIIGGSTTTVDTTNFSVDSSMLTVDSTESSVALENGILAFEGNTSFRINNSTGDLTDWTLICSFEKRSRTDGIIFSNFSDGPIKSGFVFGVTASNRLYLESYAEDGPIIFQSPTILSKKNVVAVSKVGQSLYFDYLDANSKLLESTKYETSDKGFLNSNQWVVGAAPDAPAYFSGNAFSGIIDSFILLNQPIRPNEIQEVFKGIYSTPTSTPVVDDDYIHTLGMNRIAFLSKIDTKDAFEVYAAIGKHNATGFNKDATYDRAIGEFFSDTAINGAVVAFLNGAAQVPHSGYQIGGTFYAPTYNLTGNFVPSGNQFFSNQYYNGDDRLVYDLNYAYGLDSYKYNFNFIHDGSSQTVVTPANNPSTDLVFFGGMKLALGVDYISNGTSIIFHAGDPLYDGMDGLLMVAPKHDDATRAIYGTNNVASFNSLFARKSSQVWLNGLRQNLDETYLEISDIDLLNNTGIYPENQTTLFSND